MTKHFTVKAVEFPVEELERLRILYASEKDHRHTPSIPNIKLVLLVLCARQRKRSDLNPAHEVVNESVPQIMGATGLKKSTVDDVLAFLTWIGLCRTIKKGGGKGKNPTIRFVDFENYVLGGPVIDVGETGIQVGDQGFSDGEISQLDGELPDTPLVKPLLKPVCIPSSIQNSHETGFELDKIMHAYQPEIDAHTYPSCDMHLLPEAEFFSVETRHKVNVSRMAENSDFQRECSGVVVTLAEFFGNDDLNSRGTHIKEKFDRPR